MPSWMKWSGKMKKIKDFEKNERMVIPLLINEVKNGTTSKGSPYLTVTLQDNTGMIDGKFWDVKPADLEKIHAGEVENITCEVIEYNKNLQLRINHIEPVPEGQEIEYSEYVASSSLPEKVRRERLENYIGSMENEIYGKLVRGMLEKVGEHYFSYPAASKIHHNFIGGLSEHSLSMAEMAEVIADHYPQLNRDLLIAGALIHDVGKTMEMSGPVTTEYTLQGKLEGHISLANGWLTEVENELGLADTEEAILLHHMILSHHGHYEFGSPVLPMVQEAEVLYIIDNLDARLNTLKKAMESIKPGEWTSKLFALDNRQFYKPKG